MPVKIWRRKSLLINGTLAVILVAVGVTSYLEIRPAGSSTALVTSTVQQGTVLATVSASGTLEAAQNLGLNFTTGGKVTAIDVKVGQRVKAGQVLAKVDPTSSQDSLEQAQAAVVGGRGTAHRRGSGRDVRGEEGANRPGGRVAAAGADR